MQKTSFILNSGQLAALIAVCDAFIPSLESPDGLHQDFWKAKASDHGVAEKILEIIAIMPQSDQKEFRQLMKLLESGFLLGIIGGGFKKFRSQDREKQQRILQNWSQSRIGKLRKSFVTLKKLTCFFHYGQSGNRPDSIWKAIGYPGPLQEKAAEKPRIQVLLPEDERVLTCETLVIGSGAGGGLAGGMLAEAGEDVFFVEKGPFLAGEDFNQREVEMLRKTYDRQATLATSDASTSIFAGSCLGGGTTVNWTGAFPTPKYVLHEWSKDHGIHFAETEDYQNSMQEVMQAFSVNKQNSPHNFQNKMLWKGSEKLGQSVELIGRNVKACAEDGGKGCGYCGMGCRKGNKQGTLRTWIQRAADQGARILANAEVSRITLQNGKATGAEIRYQNPQGKILELKVKAKKVILAAGAIQSPALLLRSGLHHPKLGYNLFFHPTIGVTARYEEQSDPWFGVMMSAVNKQHMRIDGNFGFWTETPPLHAGVAALALPWTSARQSKSELLKVRNMATFIVLTRDKFGGRVRTDKAGRALINYALHPYDRKHMLLGIQNAVRLHLAAGAVEAMAPHGTSFKYHRHNSKISLESWLKRIPKLGWKANQYNLFTAHQMGTCAMGNQPENHPVTTTGQFRGVSNLYLADGSLLPTSAGVNPMMTIMAMAHTVIKRMI